MIASSHQTHNSRPALHAATAFRLHFDGLWRGGSEAGTLGGAKSMSEIPTLAGGIDAYEFYVETALHFHCDDCGEHMECPVPETDVEAPNPPWATREGKRGMSLGWY